MKLWLLTQDKNTDYDTFDSMIVAANTKCEARKIGPYGDITKGTTCSGWVRDPKDVKVEYLGMAKRGTKCGIVLASFNAG